MKKEIVSLTDLTGTQQRQLTTKNISRLLLPIMKKHIGYENKISSPDLFISLFGRPAKDNLGDYLRWDFVKKSMGYLRKKTKCFIGFERVRDTFFFFVVKDVDDALKYCNQMEKTVRGIKEMEKRAVKAVNEKWYELDWEVKKEQIEHQEVKEEKHQNLFERLVGVKNE